MGSRFNKKPSVMTDADYREFAGLRTRDIVEANRADRIQRMNVDYRRAMYDNSRFGPPLPPEQPSRRPTPLRWYVPYEPTPRRSGPMPADLVPNSVRLSGRGIAANLLRTISPFIDAGDWAGAIASGEIFADPVKYYPTGMSQAGREYWYCFNFYDGAHPPGNGVAMSQWSGNVTQTYCQGLQAWPQQTQVLTSQLRPTGNTLPAINGPRTIIFGPPSSQIAQRWKNSVLWYSPGPRTQGTVGLRYRPIQIRPERLGNPNPNLLRYSPSRTGLEHVPVPRVNIGPNRRSFELTASGGGKGVPPRLTKTAGRRPEGSKPPGKGGREKKAKAAGAALFGLLDAMSEFGDIVDAIYEALPEKTKKRNPCKRNEFIIDTAGQYGISNADCKLGVLYRNWHKLDPALALRYLVANQIEDKVIGKFARALPRNIGQVADPAQKAIAKWLDDFFKAGGLIPDD